MEILFERWNNESEWARLCLPESNGGCWMVDFHSSNFPIIPKYIQEGIVTVIEFRSYNLFPLFWWTCCRKFEFCLVEIWNVNFLNLYLLNAIGTPALCTVTIWMISGTKKDVLIRLTGTKTSIIVPEEYQ